MFMCLFLLPRRSPFCFLVYSYLFLCLVGWFPFSFRKKLKMRWTNQGNYWTALFEKIKVIFSATRIITSCFNRGSKRLPHTITRGKFGNVPARHLQVFTWIYERQQRKTSGGAYTLSNAQNMALSYGSVGTDSLHHWQTICSCKYSVVRSEFTSRNHCI